MDIPSLLIFAAVFAIACSAPGPTIVALVARVVAKGSTGALAFCSGLLLGDLDPFHNRRLKKQGL